MIDIEKSVQYIKGIGPRTALLLNRINIFSINDLLMHFPRAYEDRSILKPINELQEGEMASVVGEVYFIDIVRYTKSGKHLTKVILKNQTGHIVGLWFNQKFIKNVFKIGNRYLFYGKISISFGEKQIVNPEYESIGETIDKGILPIYPSTKDLSQKILRNSIQNLFNSSKPILEEVLPEDIRNKYNLCDINTGFKNIHFPENKFMLKISEDRIKFEELLILQLGLMMEKSNIENNLGIRMEISKNFKEFLATLPFKLTNAQKKASREILNDMKSNKQMNRLVQGDVGSGKTVVAVIALFNAVKNGYQGAMMVPTEILASQQYMSLSTFYREMDIKVGLLSSKLPKKQKEELKAKIKNGEVDIVIGTHAVIQSDVEFKKLGIVITDEQHRFGVRQRALLYQKGNNPHILIMTATPIPRTLALFIYGDMDISIIDELPPGRQKIDTYAVKSGARQRVYDFIKKEVKNGRQAYVVCPLIDESDTLDVESAMETAELLKSKYLRDLNVAILHGKMKSDEKDKIMFDFKNGSIDVLVSTTVIEVGINIPNATIMVIENAERFGLAQIHQLRGRVGRGHYKSYCILISQMKSELSRKRMKILEDTSDGFIIAQKDMELRGAGQFFGIKQHGLTDLKLADIFIDADILKVTNTLAKELIKSGRIYNKEFENLRLKIENNCRRSSDEIVF